jgi:hypothetical protein
VVLAWYPELGPERLQVFGRDPEEARTEPSSTAVSGISSAAIPLSIYQ